MKNFNEQMEDLNEENFKLRNEITFLNTERKKMKEVVLALRLELCELRAENEQA